MSHYSKFPNDFPFWKSQSPLKARPPQRIESAVLRLLVSAGRRQRILGNMGRVGGLEERVVGVGGGLVGGFAGKGWNNLFFCRA